MKTERTGRAPLRAAQSTIVLHPASARAASHMMLAMSREFDRWIADDIDELAECLAEPAASLERRRRGDLLRACADRLSRQARALGYPQIARLAERIRDQTTATSAAQDTAQEIASMRRLLGSRSGEG